MNPVQLLKHFNRISEAPDAMLLYQRKSMLTEALLR